VSRDPEAKSRRNISGLLGAIAFFAGMIVAIICGAIPSTRDEGTVVLVLVILGIIVGLFNITSKEIIPFLVAAIALVVVGSVGGPLVTLDKVIDGLGTALDAMIRLIAVFMVPAAVINAVRVIWELARPGEAG
jgi:cell division protein FtsW (lipid II flippase)